MDGVQHPGCGCAIVIYQALPCACGLRPLSWKAGPRQILSHTQFTYAVPCRVTPSYPESPGRHRPHRSPPL